MTVRPHLPWEKIKTKSHSEGSPPPLLLSQLLIAVTWIVLKFVDRDLIKKVESTLLNLEKKEP